jgi:two-component system sensor histidine kinase SenX3
MKLSWTTILLTTGILALFVLLGGLQYRWLSQASEADGEKARKHAQEQADHFAMDFNREIQNAYFNFQTDADSWKMRNWSSFNERYDFWREKTAYPGLISEFFFFDATGDAAPLRYHTSSRAFVPVDMTPELADLRSRFSDDKSFKPVYDDNYTLVLPIHNSENKIERILIRTPFPGKSADLRMPERYGYLAIRLDRQTIIDKILPDLNRKYFGDEDFRAAVIDNEQRPVFQEISGETSDASAPLFDLSPDNFVFFANKDLLSTIDADKRKSVVLNSRIESHSLGADDADGDGKGEVKIEVKRDSAPKTAIFTTTASTKGGNAAPWTLQVQHSAGSIDAFVANTLRRYLAMGFGLLSLLALAIGTIIVSAQRAKNLARRQIEFVSSVSHEFRTPLAVIYSAGENLADGVAKDDSQVSSYGDLIKGEGKKLSSMVEQILDFAGANAGRRRFNFSETFINDVVAKALEQSQPIIDEKNIAVETDISLTLPSINADKAALTQALQNLIVNSIKYSNGNAWLRVSAENGNGKVKISVEDRGIGISKSDLGRIFKPFYRANEVIDAQIHGNGLGLSLVKQIAEAHGGCVFVSSEIGKGSKFTIELPQN